MPRHQSRYFFRKFEEHNGGFPKSAKPSKSEDLALVWPNPREIQIQVTFLSFQYTGGPRAIMGDQGSIGTVVSHALADLQAFSL